MEVSHVLLVSQPSHIFQFPQHFYKMTRMAHATEAVEQQQIDRSQRGFSFPHSYPRGSCCCILREPVGFPRFGIGEL